MNETTITRQILLKWKDQNPDVLWYHKIADPTFGGNSTKNRAVDVLGCYKGRFFAMEWKLKKNSQSFPFSKIRLNQIETLCDIANSGGIAVIAIATYISRTNKSLHLIPIRAWNTIINKYVKGTNQKSINIEEYFAEYEVDYYKIGTRDMWDISDSKTFKQEFI